MGLVNRTKGVRVYIDTAPFIYFIEKKEKYLGLLKPFFFEINAGNIEGLTSTITLLEVLIHPLRIGDEALAGKYREILLHSEGLVTFEIFNEISEKAAKLRAKYSIKIPDAIQIATAIYCGAHMLLTNDVSLKKVGEIEILVLDDFLL